MQVFLPDFKIYVPTQNEENLIKHTVNALKEVFDPEMIEVLDLNSQDDTVARIPADVKVTKIILEGENIGQEYTKLKNAFSKKQKWVLWVDGDEIYPVSVSNRIVDWLKRAQKNKATRQAERLYWRILKEENGYKYQSIEFLSAGPKIFNSKCQQFKRAWPEEVTVSMDQQEECKPGHKRNFTGLWFWHGVLLNRSNTIEEPTARRKKRECKLDRYNKMMTWKKLDKWPWEDNYRSELVTDWTVVHMNLNSPDKEVTRWKGKLIK